MNNNNQFNAGKTASGTNIGKVRQQNQGFGQEFSSETDVQAVREANAQSTQKSASKNFGQQNQSFGQEFASETDVQAVREANAKSAQRSSSSNFGQQNQQ